MASDGFTSPYTPNTDAERREMLEAIGVSSVEELFEDIPAELRNPTLNIPAPRSEMELKRYVAELSAMNTVGPRLLTDQRLLDLVSAAFAHECELRCPKCGLLAAAGDHGKRRVRQCRDR